MKISKEHVGKTIRRTWWNAESFALVIAVGVDTFIGMENGTEEMTYNTEDTGGHLGAWEIVEPKKRPSEIIQLDAGMMLNWKSFDEAAISKLSNKIDAILRFLDKQAEEKK